MSDKYLQVEWIQTDKKKSYNKRFKKKWGSTIFYKNNTWKDGIGGGGIYKKYTKKGKLIIVFNTVRKTKKNMKTFFKFGTFVLPSKKKLMGGGLHKWYGCQAPLGYTEGYMRKKN